MHPSPIQVMGAPAHGMEPVKSLIFPHRLTPDFPKHSLMLLFYGFPSLFLILVAYLQVKNASPEITSLSWAPTFQCSSRLPLKRITVSRYDFRKPGPRIWPQPPAAGPFCPSIHRLPALVGLSLNLISNRPHSLQWMSPTPRESASWRRGRPLFPHQFQETVQQMFLDRLHCPGQPPLIPQALSTSPLACPVHILVPPLLT